MIAATALTIASGLASAADQPGSFPGVVIDAKIIGGDQYEPLYSRIGEWEHGILDAHALTMQQSWTVRSLGDILTESSADLVAPGPAHAS